jgi:hypothetical protein
MVSGHVAVADGTSFAVKGGSHLGSGPSAETWWPAFVASGAINDPLVKNEAAKIYIEGELLRRRLRHGLAENGASESDIGCGLLGEPS